MNLKDEYGRTEKALREKLGQQEVISLEVRRLQGRLQALRLLIEQNEDPNAIGGFVVPKQHHQNRLTGLIECVFQENPTTPLHTPDLIGKLKLKGWDVGPGTASTAATIAKRLQNRGLLKRTKKDGYVAWIWAHPPDKIS